MQDNIYNTGRHMGNWGGRFNNGFDSVHLSPAVFWGLLVIGIIFAIWVAISIVLKVYALWTSARRGEKWWFIALLVVNTMGILELFYLLHIAKVSLCGLCHKKCKSCNKCGSCKTCSVDESVDDDTEEPDAENIENTKKEAEEVL